MNDNQHLAPQFASPDQQPLKDCCSVSPCRCASLEGYAFPGERSAPYCSHPGPCTANNICGIESNALSDDLAPALGYGAYYPTPDAGALLSDGLSLIDQTTSNQDWSNNPNACLPQCPAFTVDTTVLNFYDNTGGATVWLGPDYPTGLEQDRLNQPDVQSTNDVAMQATNFAPVAGGQASSTGSAVVLETSDGRFFCSQPGCDATYLRIGDCRRHLGKHNGPFFPCTQHGCGMKFYRHDKLRAHLKQGHGIIVAAPLRGRR